MRDAARPERSGSDDGCRPRVESLSRILTTGLSLALLPTACAHWSPTTIDRMPLPAVSPGRDHHPAERRVDRIPTRMTLEQAIEIALQNNPDVASSSWDLEAARARERSAQSGHWPTLGIDAAYRHHWNDERLVPARGPNRDVSFQKDILSADVVLSVPLLSGGRVVSAVAATGRMADAAEHHLAWTKEELVFNVKSTFYAILGQAKLLEALQRSRDALEEHRRKTEELIAARKAARIDALNTGVRIAEIDYRMVKQRGALDLSRELLASLLGVESIPPDRLSVEGDLAFERARIDEQRLVAAALESRSDMARITSELEAQAMRVDMARAEYWPFVSGRVSYGGRASLEGDYDDLGFAGVEMSLPLFSGVRLAARVAEERARLRSLQERRRKLALNVRREVETSVLRLRTATAQVDVTESVIAEAEESLRIAREKTSLGLGTAMDVLDAQAALLSAETAYFTSLVDLHTALALLDLSTGGIS